MYVNCSVFTSFGSDLVLTTVLLTEYHIFTPSATEENRI